MSRCSQSSSDSLSNTHTIRESVSTSTSGGFCLSLRWLTKESKRDPEALARMEQELRAQEKHEKNAKEDQQPCWSPSMRLPYHKQMPLSRTRNDDPQYPDRLYVPCESPDPGRRGAAHQQGPLCC